MKSIAQRMVTSAGAATISQLWRIGVTLATHMALRRIISPEQYGAWVWAEPLFMIFAQIRDLGVPGHVVRDESRPFGSYLALQIGWGGILSLLILAGAPIVALAYADHDAEVVAIIRVLCFFLFVQGLGSVPLTFFEAELQLARTIPAELIRNLAFAVIALGLAVSDHGVWSLVIAHVAAGTIYGAVLWWAAWGRLVLSWVPGGTLKLVRLSLPLALISVLELMVLKLDAFVLGLRFPSEVVGTAGLAIYAVFFFSRHLTLPIGRALYPAMVSLRADSSRTFEAYAVSTLFLASLTVPTAFFLFVNAEFVILFLGGSEWLGAASYLRILSLVPLLSSLTMFGPELLLTRHLDRFLILYSLFNLVSLGALGLFLTGTGLGPLGMAVASYFPMGMLILAWAIYRFDPDGLRRLLIHLGELYGVGALLFGLVLSLHQERPWLRFAFSAGAGLLVLSFALYRFGSSYRRFFRGE